MKRQGDPLEAERERPAPMPAFFAQLLPEMVDEIFRGDVVTRRLVAMLCRANLRAMEPELYDYTVGEHRAAPGPTVRHRARLIDVPERCSFAYRLARDASDAVADGHLLEHFFLLAQRAKGGERDARPDDVPVLEHMLAGAAVGQHLARLRVVLCAMRGFALMHGGQRSGLLNTTLLFGGGVSAQAVEDFVLAYAVIGGQRDDGVLHRLVEAVHLEINGTWDARMRDWRMPYVARTLINSGRTATCLDFIARWWKKLNEKSTIIVAALTATNTTGLLAMLAKEDPWFAGALAEGRTLHMLRMDLIYESRAVCRFSANALAWLATAGGITTLGGDGTTRCREWVACTHNDPDGELALRCLRERFGATDAQCA